MSVTPDVEQVVLKWAGLDFEGNPETGRLELTYDGSLLLDDGPTPVGIYPRPLRQTLQQKTLVVDGVPTLVGYAEFTVPASDASVPGSGGTYTLVEQLGTGNGQTKTILASKDADGGVVWLNRAASVTPTPGDPVIWTPIVVLPAGTPPPTNPVPGVLYIRLTS